MQTCLDGLSSLSVPGSNATGFSKSKLSPLSSAGGAASRAHVAAAPPGTKVTSAAAQRNSPLCGTLLVFFEQSVLTYCCLLTFLNYYALVIVYTA